MSVFVDMVDAVYERLIHSIPVSIRAGDTIRCVMGTKKIAGPEILYISKYIVI